MLIMGMTDNDNAPTQQPDNATEPQNADAAPAPERLCRECGTPLPDHVGRGRKPVLCANCKKTPTTRTRKGAADTEAALATMEGLYQLTAGIVMLVSPSASATMRERVLIAQNMNRSAFEADKDLARRIANAGGASAMGMFVMAQAMIVAPTIGELRADLADRRAERRAKEAREAEARRTETTSDGGIPVTDVGFFG